MTRVCTQCRKELALSEFNYKDRKRGTLQSMCRDCSRAYFRAYYLRHRAAYVARSRRKNSAERLSNRRQLLEYLQSHPCADCGESDPVVLQFDHADPAAKSSNVGDLLRNRVPWRRILAEIDKCVVRCANDHQRRTASQFGWYRITAVQGGQRIAIAVRLS
jgi:hypothetical protein